MSYVEIGLRREIARLTAERDTARAETAMALEMAEKVAYEQRDAERWHKDYPRAQCAEEIMDAIRVLTPANATTALAARDKATREAALREAKPAPQVKAIAEAAIRDCAAGAPISAANLAREILSALSGEAQ